MSINENRSYIKQTGFPSFKLEIYFIVITALMETASIKVTKWLCDKVLYIIWNKDYQYLKILMQKWSEI